MRRRNAKTTTTATVELVSHSSARNIKNKHSASDSKIAAKQQHDQEQPEDILADSQLYKPEPLPFWKRKRFHFIIGVSVGILAALGAASRTPVAQNHLSELQTYLALQLADIDLANIMPATDVVDELFGNVTNFFKPSPTSDIPFMPALGVK